MRYPGVNEFSYGILARHMELHFAGILARLKSLDKLEKLIAVCNELISSACKSIEKDPNGNGHIDLEDRRLLQVLEPDPSQKWPMLCPSPFKGMRWGAF